MSEIGPAHFERELESLLARYAEPVEFVPLRKFVSTAEPTSESLLGTTDETILPANGLLLMYGDGGAGKTTVSIDAAVHFASGEPWLELPVPRPLRVLLIENEGPRGKFRQVLAEKTAGLEEETLVENMTILEEPWTRFSLKEEEHRLALAAHIVATETDVVMMGPLVTLGMVGGGTPDEISAFELLLSLTRAACSRPFAFWIVHHENKAGDVSGAWERVPDTLVHVQSQGNGHTRLVWRKARWSSEHHGKSLDLEWAGDRSYAIRENVERDLHGELLEAFREADEWRTVREVGKLIGVREQRAREVLSDLVERGDLKVAKGVPGRSKRAHCYRLRTAPDEWEQLGAVLPFGGSTRELRHRSGLSSKRPGAEQFDESPKRADDSGSSSEQFGNGTYPDDGIAPF